MHVNEVIANRAPEITGHEKGAGDVVTMGRTRLQDAVPMTPDPEFAA